MSKIESLKSQYPNLNLSLIDLAKRLDPTKSHKYTPAICKILSERFEFSEKSERDYRKEEIIDRFKSKGVNVDEMDLGSMYVLYNLMDFFPSDNFELVQDLVFYGERNLLPTKDILKYKNSEQMKNDVSLAAMKQSEKELANQIHKEFENEIWLALRPLTFEASSKYGTGTKWCTTYRTEKTYFAKYWDRGILVYFINKKTGYKFAGFKNVKDQDLSFWNSADQRIDSLEIECDSYVYDIIKNIFKSKKTNSDFCDTSMVLKVSLDCSYIRDDYEKSGHYMVEEMPEPQLDYAIRHILNDGGDTIPQENIVTWNEAFTRTTTAENGVIYTYTEQDPPTMRG